MTDEQKKCSYDRNVIAEVYQCSRNDAELIKYLRIFLSQNINEIEELIKIDEEVKLSDFIYVHLDELKNIFHVCSVVEVVD